MKQRSIQSALLRICCATILILISLAANAADAKKKVVEIKIRDIDAAAAAKVSYTRDIKPLIVNYCLDCHSSDDHKGDLDATSIANLLKKGKKAGPAVVPGKPDESAMVQYIRGLREPQMPKGNPTLSEDELNLIRMWILAGAKDDSDNPSQAIASVARRHNGEANGETASDKLAANREAWSALMFSGNEEERLIAQRAVRTSLLPKPPVPPTVKAKSAVFNPIDQFIVAKWESASLKEATQLPEVCSDGSFLRRAYLDLIGVIPTVAEARKFLNDASPDKRAKLVDELLARKEDYAANWTPFWEDALGSENVDIRGGIRTRGNYRNWIYRSFLENKPYDVMVAELIDPTMPGYQKPVISEANGKVVVSGYVLNETHTDTLLTAANVGQVFLGTGMKCASCHNHFLNKEWPQTRFLAFAGMFSTNDLESIRCEKKSGQFVPAMFPFDLPDAPSEAPKPYDERLHRLTQLLVDPTNPRFAKTMVNRLWKRYIGIGLFAPADDYRVDQPPSHPELLDWLADDFIRHGYDLKHTIRLILTSRTYQLRYDPELEDHFDLAKPTVARYYRSPSLRRLTAEQLIDSVHLAMAQELGPKQRNYLETASTALTRALGKPASRNEISTARAEDVAVVQALELLNGEEFHEIAYSGKTLNEAAGERDFTRAIDQLYWSALSRPPSAREQAETEHVFHDVLATSAPAQNGPAEQVWVDDELPAGATSDGTGGDAAWKWVSGPEYPVLSGKRAHTQGGEGKQRQHYLLGAKEPLHIEPADVFFAYVYLDPANPPREIMLQWNDGGWDHRAFWGKDVIPFGAAKSPSRHPMGKLPEAGAWVRLEIPAKVVGFHTATDVGGWSFDQDGGTVYWDKAGLVKRPENPKIEPLGDVMWALVTSPEFQYIR
jgi:Protein of unknown function (DUF1553)/Protein of unknown function (DUF1549)/Planctomycete cytochrome C